MDPAEVCLLGRTGVGVSRLGFGGLGVATFYTALDDIQARATLDAAWAGGVRLYDTAPSYGNGLSEHRIGRFLHGHPGEDYVLSTKVGKLLRPARRGSSNDASRQHLPFDVVFDYSHGGIMRAHEDSLQRLGLDHVDLAVVHDLDRGYHSPSERFDAHLSNLLTGGWRALEELHETGVLRGIGIGINEMGLIPRFLDLFPVDFFLLAMRYTVMEQGALDVELPRCQEAGVAVVVGSVFNSGLTVMGPVPGARYNYGEPTEEQFDRARRLHAVCGRHGVAPAAAALQFPLAHPAVVSVLAGAFSPAQVEENLQHFREGIPGDFWTELKHEGVLREDAPVPDAPRVPDGVR